MAKVTTRTPAGSVITVEEAGLSGYDIRCTLVNQNGHTVFNAVLTRNAADALSVALVELLGFSAGEFTLEREG